jgi:hypothetical protein
VIAQTQLIGWRVNVLSRFRRADRNDFSSLKQGVNLPDSAQSGWSIPN